jgi:hypothetical protein
MMRPTVGRFGLHLPLGRDGNLGDELHVHLKIGFPHVVDLDAEAVQAVTDLGPHLDRDADAHQVAGRLQPHVFPLPHLDHHVVLVVVVEAVVLVEQALELRIKGFLDFFQGHFHGNVDRRELLLHHRLQRVVSFGGGSGGELRFRPAGRKKGENTHTKGKEQEGRRAVHRRP